MCFSPMSRKSVAQRSFSSCYAFQVATWIEPHVTFEAGAMLEPNVYLGGKTHISAGVRVVTDDAPSRERILSHSRVPASSARAADMIARVNKTRGMANSRCISMLPRGHVVN